MLSPENCDATGVTLDILSDISAGARKPGPLSPTEIAAALIISLDSLASIVEETGIGRFRDDILKFKAIVSPDGIIHSVEATEKLKEIEHSFCEVFSVSQDFCARSTAARIIIACAMAEFVIRGGETRFRHSRDRCIAAFDAFVHTSEFLNIFRVDLDHHQSHRCGVAEKLARHNILADLAQFKKSINFYFGVDVPIYRADGKICHLYTANPMELWGHLKSVTSLAECNGKLFTSSADSTIKVWDLKSLRERTCLTSHTKTVNALAVWGSLLLSGSDDTRIRVWNTNTLKEIKCLRNHQLPVLCLAVHHDRLFSGSAESVIKIWDLRSLNEIGILRGHSNLVHSLLVHNDTLVSTCKDSIIKLWDLTSFQELNNTVSRGCDARTVAIFDNKLFTSNWDNTVKVLDIETLEEIAVLRGHDRPVTRVLVSGSTLFSGSLDNTVRVWDTKTLALTCCLHGHSGPVTCLLEHRGRIFSGSEDNTTLAHFYV